MPLSPLGAHYQVLTCFVTCLFIITKNKTFKQIARLCYSIYYQNNGSHLKLHFMRFLLQTFVFSFFQI